MTAVVRDQDVVAGAVLRVRAGDEVVGGAFLVAPDLVATTATVVAEALRQEAMQGDDPGADEAPTGTVQLEFPLLQPEHDLPTRIPARVHRWSPARGGGNGSAVLRLLHPAPPGARMPPLRSVAPLDGRSFSVLGFPEGLVDGVWSTGRLRAAAGHQQRLHLDGAEGEFRVDAGFAGAPVWEAGTGAVVGMAGYRHGPDAAELIGIHEVLGFDPEQLPCPYQGLRTFDETDAGTFFGRDDDIERLVDLVARQPVVAVAGPSGAGKSSLVRAGLVPRLRAAGAEIVYVRAAADALDQLPAPGRHDHEIVIVIDQFEDLAALDPAAARTLLDAAVQRTRADRGVRTVLTLRWSTLDEMLTPELVDTLDAATVLVGPLDRDRLQDAIVRPAEHPPGLAFEPGLVETILDDAGAEPGRLPLVESLLADLWERREGGYLTQREYEAAGGVAGALAQHAESVVDSLPAGSDGAGSDGAGSDGAVRRLLTALARPDRDGSFVRRAVRLDELPPPQRALVPALAAGRLLTVGRSGQGDVVELAHQALIEHWPRLRAWLSADRAFLAWREQVGIQRERWEAEDRADSVLLRGAPLAAASDWLSEREVDLPRADLDYLRRSAARQRREVRRWQIIATAVAVLVLAAGALTVISVRSGDRIVAELAAANADTLGREAQARAGEDPAAAAQLALTAWREDPRDPQARSALLRSVLAMRSVKRELPDLTRAPITDMLVGGDTAVLKAQPHPVVVTGLSGPAPRHAELPDVSSDRHVALSLDGRWLAVQAEDRTTYQLRDPTGTRAPMTLPHTDGAEVGGAGFSPDSGRLAWVEIRDPDRPVVRIWDLRAGTEVRHGLASVSPDVAGVQLSSDPGRIIVRRGDSRSADSRLVLLSLTDGVELTTFPAGAQVVLGGTAVATCEAGTGEPSTAALLVTPLDGSAPRRVGLRWDCAAATTALNPEVSGNGNALVEANGHALVITDLRTGEVFHVTAPADLQPVSLWGFNRVPAFALLPDRPVGVLARGTSLLWLRAEPAAAGPAPGEWNIAVGDDIRIVRNRDGLRAEERATGRTLGELPGVRSPSDVVFVMPDSLWVGRVAGTGWDVTRHEPPTLRRTSAIRLPGRDGGTPPADREPELEIRLEPATDGGRLFAMGDGVLSVWDPVSGRSLGPPIHLGATPAEVDFHRSNPYVQARPGHPGQLAVLGADDVQIWDVPAARLVTTVPTDALIGALARGAVPIMFDATGDRLAVLGGDRTVQLWDIPSTRPVRPPIPAPTVTGLVGFAADGHLVATQRDDESTLADILLAFVDLGAGAEAGSVNINDATGSMHIVGLGDDRRTLRLDDLDGERTVDVPVTAQGWRDALCTAVGRELTAGERSILPPGANADPPCS